MGPIARAAALVCRVEQVLEKLAPLVDSTQQRFTQQRFTRQSTGHPPGQFDAVQVPIDEFKAYCISFSASDDREAGRESGFSNFRVKVEQEFE